MQTVSAATEAPAKAPGLIQMMIEDARAALDRDPSAEKLSDIVLFSTGTHIVWAHRRHHWLYTHGFRKLALLLAKRMRRKLGADIHPAATIGRRFTIDHGFGIVIGGTAEIGDDVLMYQGVTLGMTGKKLSGKRHPTVGSNVLLGANATVLGDIRIGDGARVGAGSVVVHDVPSRVTVAGVPAHIVREYGKTKLRLVDALPDAVFDENVRWSCTL